MAQCIARNSQPLFVVLGIHTELQQSAMEFVHLGGGGSDRQSIVFGRGYPRLTKLGNIHRLFLVCATTTSARAEHIVLHTWYMPHPQPKRKDDGIERVECRLVMREKPAIRATAVVVDTCRGHGRQGRRWQL